MCADLQLVRESAKGNRESFQLLYERHWRAVYRYACLLTRSVSDAEDITQECFLVLIRRPASFDATRSQVRTWLIAVARNQYLGKSRNQARAAAEAEDQAADSCVSIEEELIACERAGAVQRAVEALPLLQRETLYLFEFEGLSLSDTASVLEIDANAVEARLHRARERLKRILEPQRAALSRIAMEKSHD